MFVREVEEKLSPNYHVSLTGSVLHVAHSNNDVDLFVFPHNSHVNSHAEINSILEEFGMVRKLNYQRVQDKWASHGSSDKKRVEKYLYLGKQVDVFYYPEEK